MSKYAKTMMGSSSTGKNAIIDPNATKLIASSYSTIFSQIGAMRDELNANPLNKDAIEEKYLPSIQKMIEEFSRLVTILKELRSVGVTPDVANIGKGDGIFIDINALSRQYEEAEKVYDTVESIKKAWKTANENQVANIKGSEKYEEMESNLKNILSLQERYKVAISETDRAHLAQQIEEETENLKKLIVLEKQEAEFVYRRDKNSRYAKLKEDDPAEMHEALTLAKKMQDFVNKNTALRTDPRLKEDYGRILDYKDDLGDSILRAKSSNTLEGISNGELKRMQDEFSRLELRAKQFGVAGKTAFERISEAYRKFGGWMITSTVIMELTESVHRMVENVRELDSAMTELKKVTDESTASYESFLERASSMSKEVGASIAEAVFATADFSRQGYNLEDSEGLAKQALIYKNVGDNIGSINDASQSITSTMKAFYNEAENGLSVTENATHIIDSFNEVSNNFAISSGGIGEALQRSASALAAGGNTLEESIGMITAANEIAQDPDRVGTAMKTLSMYLRSAKAEAEEAGIETEGMANSTAKLRDTIMSLTGKRVDIMSDETTLKSTFQVYKEIAAVWDSMTDIDRAALLESLGGKRNANITAAIIENFKQAEKAAETAEGSMGSAAKENEKYLDSINGRISLLKSTFESLSENLLGSTAFKVLVSLLTDAVKVTDFLVDKLGAIPVVLTSISAAMKGMKLFENAKKDFRAADFVSNSEIDNSGIFGFFKAVKRSIKERSFSMDGLFSRTFRRGDNMLSPTVSVYGDVFDDKDKSDERIENIGDAAEKAGDSVKSLGKSGKKAGDDVSAGAKKGAAGVKTLKDYAIAAKASMRALSIVAKEVAASFVIGLAIEGVYKMFDLIAGAAERQAEASREAADAVLEEYGTTKKQVSRLILLLKSIKTLEEMSFPIH